MPSVPINTPLGSDFTQQLIHLAHSFCEHPGGCHGPDHVHRVHSMAIAIGTKLQADLRILSAAAILHDIGRKEETNSCGRICHARFGAEQAAEILVHSPFSEMERSAIVHCIATHRYRGNAVPKSLEAKILFDADKLDSIGATGIGRAFLFAGQIGAKLHNSSENIEATEAYSLEDTAYREYCKKLSKVRERMLTEIGRQMADERHRFMEMFFAQLNRETSLIAQ